jgi:hypothetical protein
VGDHEKHDYQILGSGSSLHPAQTLSRPEEFQGRAGVAHCGALGPRCGKSPAELNRGCFGVTLDKPVLAHVLDREVGVQGFAEQLNGSHPTLFSNVPVFVPAETLQEMAGIVTEVEACGTTRKGSQLPATAPAPAQ